MNTITNLNTFPIGNSLDGINIITEEINTLSLLVDGTNYMLADLNMDNHSIKNLDAGVDSLDAVNKTQLDLKADTNYVDTQLNTKVNKSGDTMTGALNMNSTNKITNLANGTNPGDAVNKTQLDLKADTSYVDTQLNTKVNKSGDTMTGALNMNSTNKITNLANGTNPGDAVNLGQLTAINDSLTADINDLETYVDTQDNLKVNKAGDTMTGNLVMSGLNSIRFNNDPTINNGASLFYATNFNECILAVNAGTSDRGFDLRVSTGNPLSTSTRLWVQPDGKVGINTRTPSEIFDVNGNTIIRGILDVNSNKIINLENGTNANDAVNLSQLTDLRNYTDASLNLKVDRAGDTMTGVLTINKNASNTTTGTTSSTMLNFVSGQTTYDVLNTITSPIYDIYNLTASTAVYIYLPHKTSSDTSLLNKIIYFNFSSPATIYLSPYGGSSFTINVNGVDRSALPFLFETRIKLICSSTVGFYTTSAYEETSNTEQLVLKTNYGENRNNEFTGIKFQNTSTDAGSIKTETDRFHNNSTMSFEVRQSNSIIKPLTISANLNAINPYLVNGVNICTIGYNQTWQTLTSSRVKSPNTPSATATEWYQNTTGRPISVNANFTGNNDINTTTFGLEVSTTNSSSGIYADRDYTANDSNEFTLRGIIPASGQTWYRVVRISTSGNTNWSINYWSELR